MLFPVLISSSSLKDGIVALGEPHIHLKTERRDGRKSRAEVVDQYLPHDNERISFVLNKFAAIGIDTPSVVALLGAHSVGRTHCVKLVHRRYPLFAAVGVVVRIRGVCFDGDGDGELGYMGGAPPWWGCSPVRDPRLEPCCFRAPSPNQLSALFHLLRFVKPSTKIKKKGALF